MTVVEHERVTVETEREASVRDVLHRAADILGEWGWCQGAAQRGDSFCALGAIFFAATGQKPASVSLDRAEETPLYWRARAAFSQVAPALARWNDQPHVTKEKVVAKLREAAERWA